MIVVPPGWAHATISADPRTPLTFGAWCDREYGFEYDQVRAHKGLAWYALLDDGGRPKWFRNPNYIPRDLCVGPPQDYRELSLTAGTPIYTQFEKDPDAIQWVSDPELLERQWTGFTPCRAD